MGSRVNDDGCHEVEYNFGQYYTFHLDSNIICPVIMIPAIRYIKEVRSELTTIMVCIK